MLQIPRERLPKQERFSEPSHESQAHMGVLLSGCAKRKGTSPPDRPDSMFRGL